MLKASKRNRKSHLRHLAALAAIGLISLSGASPALGDNVSSSGSLDPTKHRDGLEIISDGLNPTAVTWDDTAGNTIGLLDNKGLVFSDGDIAGGGSTSLTLNGTGAGVYSVNGGITNKNHQASSSIDMPNLNTVLIVNNGDITGNNDQTLEIRNNGGTFVASDSDVTGNVSLRGSTAAQMPPVAVVAPGTSSFIVDSIGQNSKAAVSTSGQNKIVLQVDKGFGAAGESSLTLAGAQGTEATIVGNIGSAASVGNLANKLVISGDSTLNVAGTAMGDLTVTNNGSGGNFKLNQLGDTGNLTLDGWVDINSIVGDAFIQAQNGTNANVFIENGDVNPATYGNLGNTTDNLNLNLTLGQDNEIDATPDRVNLRLADIVGSMNGPTSTTLNIDTANAILTSSNPSGNTNVSGQVNIKLIGSGKAGGLELGELQQGSTLTVAAESTVTDPMLKLSNGIVGGVTNTPGYNNFTEITVKDGAGLLAAQSSSGNIRVVNENRNDDSLKVIINEIANAPTGTTLQVGRGNPVGSTSTSSVLVDKIAGGADLSIASVENPDGSYDRGQVTLDAQGIVTVNGGDPTIINLGNAILKVADDSVDPTHNDMGWAAGSFSMNSANGESRLIGDQGSNMTNDNTLVFNNAATVEVGKGGDVTIESDSLEYNDVLKSADNDPLTNDLTGAVHFADAANGNKMIFKSSDNTNKFMQGVQIAAGNWDFQGSTTIVAQANNTLKNSQAYFTGNTEPGDPTSSTFTIDGSGGAGSNTIDATDSNLHLNKQLGLAYVNGGSLKDLGTVTLGDTAPTSVGFGANTLLTAEDIIIGDVLTNPDIVTDKKTKGGHSSTLHGDLLIGGSDPMVTAGLQGDSITLYNTVTVDGTLTIKKAADTVLTIGAQDGGFKLTDNSLASSVEEGAEMKISNDVYEATGFGFGQIKVLQKANGVTEDLDQLIKEMSNNLTINTKDLEDKFGFNGEVHVGDNGVVTIGDYGTPDDPTRRAPSFAQPMMRAVAESPNFGDLSIYLKTGAGNKTSLSSDAYNRELTQIMGNTMNSSLSLVQNGSTLAFSRLNASLPTLTGYNTAVAVAAPRRAPAPAQAAPSASIGVPIRATDVQPASAPAAPATAVPAPPAAVAPVAPASGSDDGRPNGLWISPNYTKMSVDGDYSQGYGDFDVKSFGAVLGYDKWVNENARLGAFVSYSSPELSGDSQDITADDMQLGVYGQGIMANGVVMNAALSLGRQDYSSTRQINLSGIAGYDQEVKADYKGQTMGAALEISRPTILDNNMFVRPALGYSYQSIRLDDITEESNIVNQAHSLAQKISSNSFNLQQARVGADIGWVNPDNSLTVNGRAFLVANLGDTQPEGTASFISAGASPRPFSVHGAEMDDTMANLGLGLKFTPAGQDGLIISLDYDAMLGSNTQSHNLGLMIRYEF